jgi:hypothetical protein
VVSESTWKGALAEFKITTPAIELGIPVLKPVLEGLRYDLVFDLGERLLRVQCKWASRKNGVLVVYTRTSRHTPAGYVRSRYDPSEIDAIAAYSPDTGRCYLMPIDDVGGRWVVHLRLRPAANNQEVAIKYAAQYELGAIAQLGERWHGMPEVEGSSPSSSTSEGPP